MPTTDPTTPIVLIIDDTQTYGLVVDSAPVALVMSPFVVLDLVLGD